MDLARAFRRLGHDVDVLAPADEDTPLPEFVTSAGRSVGIPYNGSVARLAFGPVSFARVRRWIREHDFDVLHLHEPAAPSLSMLALMLADGPIVVTFHTSTPRSRALLAFQGMLQPFLEKVTARIAVSALARRVQVEHLGGDAVEIPNGVDAPAFAQARPLNGYPRAGGTVGFVGRFEEPRKGMPVLLEALRLLADGRPAMRLLVVGSGDVDALRRAAGPGLTDHLVVLGQVDDATKARALRSVDVYCAPNTGGESFGITLTEALAAGATVLASDLDAFGPDRRCGRFGHDARRTARRPAAPRDAGTGRTGAGRDVRLAGSGTPGAAGL
jgi:phosphatidylinositol alpha-mannosyltransferase